MIYLQALTLREIIAKLRKTNVSFLSLVDLDFTQINKSICTPDNIMKK